MSVSVRIALSIAATLYAVFVSGPVSALEARDWTVMVYMNGDNNLEADLLDDAHEIFAAEHPASIKVVFQLDRHPDYDERDGNWIETFRFEDRFGGRKIQYAVPDTAIPWPGSALIELNMGEPDPLSEFVTWARSTYPAEHYALILAGHGQGARGDPLERLQTNQRTFGPDETARDGDFLFVREAREAIRKSIGTNQRLDVLGFDSCLMGTVEVAYAFRSVAKYVVASKAKEPGDGWDYSDWLGRLVKAMSLSTALTSGEAFAKNLVDSYRRKRTCDGLQGCVPRLHTTLSAVNLDAVDGLVSVLGKLAVTMKGAQPSDWPAIESSRKAKSTVQYPGYLSVDLKGFLTELRETPAFRAGADGVLTALKQATVASFSSFDQDERADLRGEGAGGLAIYFPDSDASYLSDPNRRGYDRSNLCYPMDFVQSDFGGLWVEFVHEYVKRVRCTSRCRRPVQEFDACPAGRGQST